jgi:hypothetical protein
LAAQGGDDLVSDPVPPRTLAEWLRLAHRDELRGCPPPEAYLAEEMAALPAAQREELVAHAAACPACAAERDLARAFDEGTAAVPQVDLAWVLSRLRGEGAGGERGDLEAGNTPRSNVVPLRGRRAAVPWLRLAAAAVLVVAVGLFFQTLRSPTLPPPPDGGVVRSGTVEAVAPRGEVGEVPGELRWRPVAGASTYRVRLRGADGDLLWEGEAGAAAAALPAEIMSSLHRAVAYSWSVEAADARGGTLGRSGEVAFRVAPTPEGE